MKGPARGAVLPHAPLLVEGVSASRELDALVSVRDAIRSIHWSGCRAIVVLSPHGSAAGVYREVRGDLRGFGVSGGSVFPPTDRALADELAEVIGTLEGPADHGIVVPLAISTPEVPVVAVSVGPDGEATDPLIEALSSLSGIGVVASANLSPGTTARGPLTEIEGAAQAERSLVDGLREDAGSLAASVDNVPGTCATEPFRVLGRLFEGRPGRVLAYDAPVGVGYLVATVER